MADEPISQPQMSEAELQAAAVAASSADSPEFADPAVTRDERPRRTLWGVLALVATIVIVILLLLLLPRCSGSGADSNTNNDKTIVAVPKLPPVEGAVSLWIATGSDIDRVLAAAGVEGAYIDLGQGRYVIEVPPGTEKRAAAKLVSQEGVYDAGLVYESPVGK